VEAWPDLDASSKTPEGLIVVRGRNSPLSPEVLDRVELDKRLRGKTRRLPLKTIVAGLEEARRPDSALPPAALERMTFTLAQSTWTRPTLTAYANLLFANNAPKPVSYRLIRGTLAGGTMAKEVVFDLPAAALPAWSGRLEPGEVREVKLVHQEPFEASWGGRASLKLFLERDDGSRSEFSGEGRILDVY